MPDIANTTTATVEASEPPIGLCGCGCQGRTSIAPRTRPERGWISGQPVRFIKGHATRKQVRYVEADTGYKSPCWLWQLSKNGTGYGRMTIDGRHVTAHRHYYEQQHGPLPEGVELDHLCRVRCCVRPSHVEPVSHAENCRRGRRAKLTSDQVAKIRASSDTQRVIARRFGISQSQVARIRRGQSWRRPSDPDG